LCSYIISAYSNKKIAELRLLCQQRGLQYSGLRKAQLINLLVDNGDESELAVDEMEQPMDNTVNSNEEVDDEVITGTGEKNESNKLSD